MTPTIEKAISRPLGVANSLVNNSVTEEDICAMTVVLTAEAAALDTQNGRWCFVNALALLPRVVGNVAVILPQCTHTFRKQVEKICSQAWSIGSLQLVQADSNQILASCDAALCVGAAALPSAKWIAINCNGWVARLASDGCELPSDCGQPNPISAMMAASLGVAEVFKKIIGVPFDIAPPLRQVEFSLFDLTTSPDSIGPELPEEISLPDTLLVGAGAIGNGIALLLSQLPLRGRLHIVDKQDYGDENLGTCVLLKSSGWLGEPKAEQLAAWLRGNSSLDATGEKGEIESAISGDFMKTLAVDLVLNGLDDVNARRATQGIWPRIMVDGGINEVGAAVIQHRLDREDLACLMCWFDPPALDEKTVQSKLTGLSKDSLADLNRPLSMADVEMASEDKRGALWKSLEEHKSVCSVISEATLSALGVEAAAGFRPSVPFVATAAAALVVAQAIKALVHPEKRVVPKYQIGSLFLGPEISAIELAMAPINSCQCVAHRGLINRIRQRRQRMNAPG